jgi:signal transduction histidine kinase
MELMIEDLLAYSRAGRKRHEPVIVDTAVLVHDVAELLAPPAGFVVTADPALPVLTAERAPLETVLRNLIGNAIKHHNRPQEGQVTVRAQSELRGRAQWYEFVVADDGPGIDPEFHARIFEMFQTLRARDEVEGSGIGLAVVKKIVESRGGRIWVESGPGQGTAIHFTWQALPPA